MADESTPYRDSLLNAQKLRELAREARGGFAPDHVARALRHREPIIDEGDAADIVEILRELVEAARVRLTEAGIEPEYSDRAGSVRLPKREREYVTNLGALLSFLTSALISDDQLDNALQTAREGMAWCRVSGDYLQQSILWTLLEAIYRGRNELANEEHAARMGLEAARQSRSPAQIVASITALCSVLVMRWRLDEAEEINEEGLAIARTELSEDVWIPLYVDLLMNASRILMYRTQYAEGIRILREALRWADPETNPRGRATVLAHLGSTYLRLQHYQQSIECQHEVIRLADVMGSKEARSWGYFRLAECHWVMKELALVEEMLDRASESMSKNDSVIRFVIPAKRAQLAATRGDYDEAVRLCKWIIDTIGDQPAPDLLMFAYKTLAETEQQRGRYEDAERCFRRSIEIADENFPARTPVIKLALAEFLLQQEREDDIIALLDEIALSQALNPSEQMRACMLRATIAERRGDLCAALDYEREAFAHERTVLERCAEESLKNARIVAETDLLEREADLERERRRRVERELAEAVIQLGDRKRLVETIEQRLHEALAGTGSEQERSVVRALRETLAELHAQSHPQESPLRYLNGVDDDFYRRLRQRCPDLTAKQERLCGLLRAGLASKEISSLLNLGPEGLKAQRKRLRKKLDLKADERLETVLAEM